MVPARQSRLQLCSGYRRYLPGFLPNCCLLRSAIEETACAGCFTCFGFFASRLPLRLLLIVMSCGRGTAGPVHQMRGRKPGQCPELNGPMQPVPAGMRAARFSLARSRLGPKRPCAEPGLLPCEAKRRKENPCGGMVSCHDKGSFGRSGKKVKFQYSGVKFQLIYIAKLVISEIFQGLASCEGVGRISCSDVLAGCAA